MTNTRVLCLFVRVCVFECLCVCLCVRVFVRMCTKLSMMGVVIKKEQLKLQTKYDQSFFDFLLKIKLFFKFLLSYDS